MHANSSYSLVFRGDSACFRTRRWISLMAWLRYRHLSSKPIHIEAFTPICIRGGRSRLRPNDAQRRGNRRLGITGDRDAPVGVAWWVVASVQLVRSYGSARSLGGRLNTVIAGRTYELKREGAIFPSGAVRYDGPRYVGPGVHSGGA